MRRPSPRGGRAPDRTRSHQQFALLPRCVAERLSLRRLAARGAPFFVPPQSCRELPSPTSPCSEGSHAGSRGRAEPCSQDRSKRDTT